VVQVRPLLRLLIDGEVVHPGFYMAAPQEPLADVITQAGGLTPRAKPLDIRIERGPQRIWTGETLRSALGAVYSIDQLSLRAGDRVLVPGRGESGSAWRVLGFLVSLPLAVVA